MKKSWKVKNKSEDTAELFLYGEVANRSWWDDEISPKQLLEDLEELGDIKTLNLRINSNGGDVFAGISISNIIQRYSKDNDVETVGIIDGLAASIATVIVNGCDKRIMPVNTMQMIHKAWTFGAGNSNDFRKLADDLDAIEETIISSYMERINITRDELIEMMEDETWLSAERCVELGFADEIETREVETSSTNNSLVMNGIEFDLTSYENVPQKLVAKLNNKGKFNNKIKTNKVKDKGGKNMFKQFETKAAYDAEIENIKNDFKKSLKGDTSFLNSIDGFMNVTDVMNKLNEVVKGETLDEVVNNIKTVKDEFNELSNKSVINERKIALNEAGLELEDLDIEDENELLEFNNFDKTVKLVAKHKNNSIKDEGNSFYPNDNFGEDTSNLSATDVFI